MARIKIKDLPRDRKISKDEMKKVLGGTEISPMTNLNSINLSASQQKQQQAIQMLSNISKMFHDTTKTIINNLRG